MNDNQNETKFNRGSWWAVGISAVILLLCFLQISYRMSLPSEGWIFPLELSEGEQRYVFSQYFENRPTPFQDGDVLVSIEGQPVEVLAENAIKLKPQRPPNWQSRQSVQYTVFRDNQELTLDVQLQSRSFWAYLVSLPAGTAWSPGLLLTTLIGLVIFSLRPGSRTTQFFLVWCAIVLSNILSIPLSGHNGSPAEAFYPAVYWLAWMYNFLIYPLVIHPMLIHLFLFFPIVKTPLRRWPRLTPVLVYGFPFLVVGTVLLGKVDQPLQFWASVIQVGFLTVTPVNILVPIISFVHTLRTVPQPVIRAQARWLLTGFIAGWVIGNNVLFFLPEIGVIEKTLLTALITALFVLALPISMAVAILRYRLFDIDIIIRRTLIYGSLTALGFGAYFLLVGGASALLQTQSNLLPAILAIGLVAVLFRPLLQHLRGAADRLLPLPQQPSPKSDNEDGFFPMPGGEGTFPWLPLARITWIGLTGVLIAIFVAGLWPRFNELRQVCIEAPCVVLTIGSQEADVLQTLGFSMAFYAGFHITVEIIGALFLTLVSTLIFWRMFHDQIGILVSSMLVLFGLNFMVETDTALIKLYPSLQLPHELLTALGAVSLILLLFLFPNGRFGPRWTRSAALLVVAMALLDPVLRAQGANTASGQMSVALLAVVLIGLLAGIWSQIYRYRRNSDTIQRQQTKWVLFGFLALLVPILGWSLFIEIFPLPPGPSRLAFFTIGYGLMAIFFLLFPISFAISIFRYRLWDIDIIIRRTLIYVSLTTLGFGAYFLVAGGASVLLQMQQNLLPVVLTIGLVAVLFRPVLRRLQSTADRFLPLPAHPVDEARPPARGVIIAEASAGSASKQSQTAEAADDTKINKRWLTIVRAAWIAVALLSLIVVIASIQPRFSQLYTVSPTADWSNGGLLPADNQALLALGLSPLFYASYFTILEMSAAIAYAFIATLIFWRRSDNWLAVLFSLSFLALSATFTPLPSALAATHSVWEYITIGLRSLGWLSLGTAFLLFPNGRFIPTWTRWLAAFWLAFIAVSLLIPAFQLPDSLIWQSPLEILIFLAVALWLVTLALIQLYRYRHASTVLQRRQTKWVVYGFVVQIGASVLAALPLVVVPGLRQPGPANMVTKLLAFTVILLSMIFLSTTISIAVLKYRLYDIDIIIRRTLVYGTMSALGLGVYLLVVGATGILLQGRNTLLPTAITIGLVAVLFQPLRRSLQNGADRWLPLPERAIMEEKKPMFTVLQFETRWNRPAVIRLLGGIALMLAIANLVLFFMTWTTPVPETWGVAAGLRNVPTITVYKLASVFTFVLLASFLGLLIIIRHPRQPIGWLLYAAGISYGLVELSGEITVLTNFTPAGSLPGSQLAAWVMNWFWITPFILYFWMMAIFPSGRLPSRRWRWIYVSVGLLALTMIAANALQDPMGSAFSLDNPLPVTGLQTLANLLLNFAVSMMAITVVGVLIIVTYRYRQAQAEEAQQLKWVVGAILSSAIAIIAGIVFRFILDMPIGEQFFNFSLLFWPVGIGVAMLRYRLYQIDIIIRRTLIYGSLVAGLALAYFGSVALIQFLSEAFTGPQSNLVIVVITLAIAALFNPVRTRFQSWIDRRFYREKVDAREALIAFAREVRTLIDLPELLGALVTRTTDLLHISHGAVFLTDAEGVLHLAESRNLPDAAELENQAPSLNDDDLSHLHQGQPISRPIDSTFPLLVPLIAPAAHSAIENPKPETLIGLLALGPRLSEQFYSREDQTLLGGLADQAGTAIYVAQLIAEKQSEAVRREETERRLEAYRHSPAGQAEQLAQSLVAQPATALRELHALTQQAGQKIESAAILEPLPGALTAAEQPLLAGLADGYRYIFSSQTAPELLPVGLRELTTWLGSPEAGKVDGATMALPTYQFCQRALEANSIPQIAECGLQLGLVSDQPITSTESDHPDLDTSDADCQFLSDLRRILAELRPAADALHAYERVDAPRDKLAYLASAVERLTHLDRLVRTGLGSADRPVIQQIAETWLAVVTGVMSDLQTQARIVCRLLTRHTWTGEVISLALSLRNDGRGAALNVKVTLVPASEYTLFDEAVQIGQLSAGEEQQIELRVRPRQLQGLSHFRARFVILYDDPRGPDQVENFADVVYLMADEGEFQFIPNPYVVGTPLQPNSSLFFGREDIIDFIQENLAAAHQNNLVLIGQRRTGKTSLLKQLSIRLGDNYLPVYLDGQSLALDPGLPNFFFSLATEISFAVEDNDLSLEALPELDDFVDSPATTFERYFLTSVRRAIGSRHLLFMLDEFEELESAVRRGNLDPSIFGFLRHLIQHTDNLSVIFCGTHRLEELAADYWNVLFNISLYRHVAYLSREEALRLIEEPVAPKNMKYDDLALEKMWRVTAGHPYFLQLLCHSLVNRHNKSERNYVTVGDVNAALDEILASGEAHFIFLWTESNPEERLVLTALSRMMPLTAQASAVQVTDYLADRGITLDRQVVSEALHRLSLRDTLRLSAKDGNSSSELTLGEVDTYGWQLGLLGLWVEKYKSLSRVVDEVRQ